MAVADQIVFRYPRDRIAERSSLTVVARFRDRATGADVIPTTVSYRLDVLNNCTEIADWVGVTTGAQVSIVITPTQNECRTRDAIQRTMLTVAADRNLPTQFTETFEFSVRNLWLERT